MSPRKIAKIAQHALRQARWRVCCLLRQIDPLRRVLNLPLPESMPLDALNPLEGHVVTVDSSQKLVRSIPRLVSGDELPWEFTNAMSCDLPATFVVQLSNARFWGYYGGSVFTAAGALIPELSTDVWGPVLHSAHTNWKLPPLRVLPGRTLSLVTPEAAANYHHWTMDLLPRAGLVARAGYRFQDFDQVLINDRQLPFQREGLARLGIDERKILRVDATSHFRADMLVVPSPRLDNTCVSRADVEFVRSLYLPTEPIPSAPHRRLYISRRDAAFRRVLNEDEILPLIRARGFEELVMSGLTVAEQARAFSEASVVLCAHGAASANLVFAHRSCRVIEFMAPAWLVPYTWTTCSHLGLPYTIVIGRGTGTPRHSLPHDAKQHIQLRVAEVEQLLAELG